MTDIADRIAKLERELTELKAQVKPPEPKPFVPTPMPKYDPTENFRLPASAVRAMVDVIPDFRGIAQEQKQGVGQPGGFLGQEPKAEPREPPRARHIPLESPPGVAICDQMMDAQDALDRAERIKGFSAAKQMADAVAAVKPK